MLVNIKFFFFISSCPWGGKKRDLASVTNEELTHSCNKCANGMGTCFGPRICCGPEMGCLLDTKETLTCRQEDAKSSPCKPYGKTCSKLSYGTCATENLCCNPDHCVPDADCSNIDISGDDLNDFKSKNEKKLEKKIIAAIKYLLNENKNNNGDPDLM